MDEEAEQGTTRVAMEEEVKQGASAASDDFKLLCAKPAEERMKDWLATPPSPLHTLGVACPLPLTEN